MFLTRIRTGDTEEALADKFDVSISTVSRKITTWANHLYCVLGSQPIWASRQQIDDSMPQCFQADYPKTRVILNCTEVLTQTAGYLLLQSRLYSQYKSRPTFKGLVGIAPHGAVNFASALFTGSIADKEITGASGILDLLEDGDSVMADKGFVIEEMLRKRGVSLNIPPFLQSKGQFSREEVHETKKIAKVRIHVEHAIRRIKEFHIFDSPLPLSLVGSVNQLWTARCLLINFQAPLIRKP